MWIANFLDKYEGINKSKKKVIILRIHVTPFNLAEYWILVFSFCTGQCYGKYIQFTQFSKTHIQCVFYNTIKQCALFYNPIMQCALFFNPICSVHYIWFYFACLLQGHRTRFETFQANNFSWLNYIVFRNQWFLGSWVVEIYARSTIWYFFWSHTASAASNRNCQNSQVFWVKEG